MEKEHVGGTCVNVGCTPTKTMVASARIAYLTHRAAEFGVDIAGRVIDARRLQARTQRTVERFRGHAEEALMQKSNLRLMFGTASFVDRKTLMVVSEDGVREALGADTIIINTGRRPAPARIERGAPMLQIAILGELSGATLKDVAFAHPTFAESLNNLFASLDASH